MVDGSYKHFQNMFEKVSKTIGLLRKLQNILPRAPLVAIYKSFIRPLLYHRNRLYDQIFNNSFHERPESI